MLDRDSTSHLHSSYYIVVGLVTHSCIAGVESCVATVQQQPNGPKRLIAFVTGSSAHVPIVLEHCRSCLPAAMWPFAVIPLQQLPQLPNGKVDVKRMPPVDWADLLAGGDAAEYVPPQNQLEQEMQDLWMQVCVWASKCKDV